MKIALQIPFGPGSQPTEINVNPAARFETESTTIGSVATSFGEIAIFVGAFLMFFWALWGVFDYLKAEGNKEALAKARKKIQWAITGFIILIAAFFISDILQSILKPGVPPLTEIKIRQ